MKRILLVSFMVMMLVVPFTTVNAINLDMESPHILAEYMPDSVDIFVGTRIGEDFIAELDAISLALYDKLPEEFGIESYSLEDVLRISMAEEGVDWDAVAATFGNYAAMGVELVDGFSSNSTPNVYFVIEVDDQKGAEEFLLKAMENNSNMPEPEMDGDNIVYLDPDGEAVIIITPTHMIATNILRFDPVVESPLSGSEEFTSTLGTLVADRYNILGFMSEESMEAFVEESNQSGELTAIGVNPADAGSTAFGFTILAGNTFTVDAATQTVGLDGVTPVNVDFLNAMPAGTDALVVATDLTGVYNNTIATLQSVAEISGEDDPTAQIPMLFGMTRLDLEEDVLSWTTGSYGIFFGADFAALLNEALSTGTISEINIDAGLVIEATDPALAQNAADKLGEFVASAIGQEDGITVTIEDGLTSIVLDIPIDPSSDPLQFELVLTTTDDAFFFGTRQSYDAVVSGATLGTDADFGKSTQYLLPDANSIMYTNSDGVVVSAAIPLAALGPVIGNIFDNIIADLGGDGSNSDGPGSSPSPMDALGDPALITQGLDTFDALLSNMTISTSIDADGIARFRATMTVNP